MNAPAQNINTIIQDFDPISLEEMKAVRLMNRIDTKYLISISKLNELYHLELQSNRIDDISALGKMNKLEYLDLSHNCISDFSPINALSIDQKRLEGQKK